MKEPRKKKSLKALAEKEWAPEDQKPAREDLPSISTEEVTLVSDPFQFQTLAVSEIQADELAQPDEDFTENLEESDAQLETLSKAMGEEAEKNSAELEKLAQEAQEQALDPAAELAQQIAEDEALEKELAREAEAEKTDPALLEALPKRDSEGELDLVELQSCIETLLFMSDRPVTIHRLKELLMLEADAKRLKEALEVLMTRYQEPAHGFELVAVAGGYQFRTKPGRAALASRLAKVQTQRLSRGAMETLAIIAYKQPVMKEDVDKIRGVDSSHFIRGLLDKRLIEITGRSELPGRPIVYGTSSEFLQLFGLADLSALPPLRELEQMVPASEIYAENEDPKVKEMRRLVGEMKADRERLAYDPKEDEKLLTEIRERVKSIPTSTPYLEALKEAEKAGETLETTVPASETLPLPDPVAASSPEVASPGETDTR